MGDWMPYGLDFAPVALNSLHSPALARVAALAFEFESEFLCLRSLRSGRIGTLSREALIDPASDSALHLGFTMLFGYSEPLEALLSPLLEGRPNLQAGVTLLGVFRGVVRVDECKVIALVSEDPAFDEEGFLGDMERSFSAASGGRSPISFFAERFGYRRFSIPFETDDPREMAVTRLLYEFEFPETRAVVGPPPERPLPDIVGTSILLGGDSGGYEED